MLDKKSELLLKYICEYCSGVYKIITLTEMQNAFPIGYGVEQEEIKKIIKNLVNGDYILNKYCDEEQYCLYCLNKGKGYLENKNYQRQNEVLLKNQVIKLTFISTLIASLIGTTINIIASIIIKIC